MRLRAIVCKDICWGPDDHPYNVGDSIEGEADDILLLEDKRVVVINRIEPMERAIPLPLEQTTIKHVANMPKRGTRR
jgi:hypothetical protein